MIRRKHNNKFYSYQFRLYPSIEQQELLSQHIFSYNQAYNITINKLKEYYQEKKEFPSTSKLRIEVQTILEKRKLKYNSKVIQYAVDACKNNYYKKQIPRYKESNKLSFQIQKFIIDEQSFTFVRNNKRDSYIRMFREKINLRYHKELPENIFKEKMISIRCENDLKWYCTITFEIIDDKLFQKMNKEKFENNEIKAGIDTNKNNITFHIDNKTIPDKLKKKLTKTDIKSKIIDNNIILDITEPSLNDKKNKNYNLKLELENKLNKIYQTQP